MVTIVQVSMERTRRAHEILLINKLSNHGNVHVLFHVSMISISVLMVPKDLSVISYTSVLSYVYV